MKLCIIGAGGIGSYLIKALSELMEKGQIGFEEISVFDNDEVEESNILYQDFDIDDILEYKVEALAKRYRVIPHVDKIENVSQLQDFDLVVCCVDNSTTRRLIFSAYDSIHDFVDLRSEGKSYAVYTKVGNEKEYLLTTLPNRDIEGGSCQLEVDKLNGQIQQGNKIVALIGSQVILDRSRGIKTPLRLVQSL